MQPDLMDLLEGAAAILVVSPHLDDAALSCEALVGQDRTVDVVTVFAGRPAMAGSYSWDQYCGFADSDEAMTARLAEDDAAFAATPHRLHRLPLLDAQYLRGGRRPHDDTVQLQGWVDEWLNRQQGRVVVFLPAGAGLQARLLVRVVKRVAGDRVKSALRRWRQRQGPGQFGPIASPDHRWVRDTLAGRLTAADVPVVLYEEFPYVLARGGDAEVNALATALNRSVDLTEVAVDRAAKAARVAQYRSQARNLVGGTQALQEGADPLLERYWFLGAPTAG